MSHGAETSNKPVVELIVLGGVAALAAFVFMSRGPEQDATAETIGSVPEESQPADAHEHKLTEPASDSAAEQQPADSATHATTGQAPAGVEPSAAANPSLEQAREDDKSCTAPCRPPRRCVRGFCKLPMDGAAPDDVQPGATPAPATRTTSAVGAPDRRGECAKGETECNGQCVNLRNDAKNCGDCGLVCSLLHQTGTPRCQGGRCVSGACQAGWANCDDMSGCETDITTVENCGSCFTRCLWYDINGQRVRGKCVNGACVAPVG